jgi:hypothetical protein
MRALISQRGSLTLVIIPGINKRKRRRRRKSSDNQSSPSQNHLKFAPKLSKAPKGKRRTLRYHFQVNTIPQKRKNRNGLEMSPANSLPYHCIAIYDHDY